jgi:predicted N-acetyltransferase YhbS
VPEAELSPTARRRVASLLASAFPHERVAYERRAWRLVEPLLRILATQNGEIVGQTSVFEIATEPPYRLFGIGDVAVAEPARGRGIGGALCRASAHEAWSKDAEILLTSTHVLTAVFERLGFLHARGDEFYWLDEGAPRRQESWMYALRAGVRLAAPVRLAEGDF